MRYEELKDDHIAALAKLYVEANNAPPWNDEWTEKSATCRLMQMLRCDGFYGLVSFEADSMTGMILSNHEYFYNRTHFFIKEFCVDVRLRNKGIGTLLLEEFITRLKFRGINEVYLFTSRTDVTEKFYRKRGFKSWDNMVLMGKSLGE